MLAGPAVNSPTKTARMSAWCPALLSKSCKESLLSATKVVAYVYIVLHTNAPYTSLRKNTVQIIGAQSLSAI